MTEPRQDRYWNSVVLETHYLDAFLGDLKRRAHLDLVERWSGRSKAGRVLKTDLFEEAMGPDAYHPELGNRGARSSV